MIANSPDVTVKISPKIFNDVYRPFLDCQARTQIFFGGSSSGKSWFVIGQRAVIDLMRGGRNYLICRAVGNTIRRSVFNQIERTIIEFGVHHLFTINKSEMMITCNNGYQIFFAGLDDVEKIKSITPLVGAITDIVIEEATETNRDNVKSLLKRQRGGDDETTKRLVLLFNPILQTHWIYVEYFAPIGWADSQTKHISDDLAILKTTHKDNRFLTQQDHDDLDNEQDEYYYNVYTLGNWGILGDVIFKNWIVADLDDPKSDYYLPEAQRTNPRNGLDFGFGSDPAAMPATHYNRAKKHIYIFAELHERGLTNDLLAEEVKALVGHWFIKDGDGKLQPVPEKRDGAVCMGTDYVTCDSAEPKSIMELQKYGINAIAAKKGKDSVNFGIQWLQQQTIIIHTKCVKSQLEIQQYQWKKDKDGNSMKVPVEKNDHIIDGLRYGYENDMQDINPRKMIDAV